MHRWNVKTPTLFPEPAGMIVYGDPSYQESMATLVERLEKSLSAADPLSLDDLRGFFIEAGMLEQAVEDALPDHAERCRRLTDAAAEAFVWRWDGHAPQEDEMAVLRRAVEEISRLETALTIKIPEGFAFYGLYPESYIEAARYWFCDYPEALPFVVGLRSIGTTLSAVVAATLRAKGLAVERTTVRPTGHPFRRETHLERVRGADCALVVDEGPGLSGSSMAAVAEALYRAGLPRQRIAFLPGHGGEPGAQASEATRAWWRDAPRYVVGTESLRWQGQTLEEILADRTGDAVGVEELTGGRWRALAFADPSEWPPLDAPFERRKLLVRRKDGSAVLWKYDGLVASPKGRGIGKPVLGFASSAWIGGRPLTMGDATPEFLTQMGLYIANSAGPPLPSEEAETSRARLADMLCWNAQEAGIEGKLSFESEHVGSFSATDDRLAPWEWRRLPHGEIVKAGRKSPTGDHTVVGRQPLEWSIAAAVVEWALDDATAAPLFGAIRGRGVEIDVEALPFYCAAYAAFRLGMTIYCMAGADIEEKERLAKAEARYRSALRNLADAPNLSGATAF